jgi:hypothetical protein
MYVSRVYFKVTQEKLKNIKNMSMLAMTALITHSWWSENKSYVETTYVHLYPV